MELLTSKSWCIGGEWTILHSLYDFAPNSRSLLGILYAWWNNRGSLNENLDFRVFGNITGGCWNKYAVTKDGSHGGFHKQTSLIGSSIR
jgi:hypothetical protein